jgi:hypothetical protein
VGESHDSVVEKINKPYSTVLTVTSSPYGPVVEKSYSYGGKKFTLRFERVSQDEPLRLTKIHE